jgi:methionyl-tRNA synthetase
MREIMALADAANQYVDERQAVGTGQAGRQGSRTARRLLNALKPSACSRCYLKPVLPKVAAKVEAFLNIAPLTWPTATAAAGHAINAYST